MRKTRLIGNPDPQHISASMVERANLTMRHRMRWHRMRWFVRKTTAFGRNAENHAHAVDP